MSWNFPIPFASQQHTLTHDSPAMLNISGKVAVALTCPLASRVVQFAAPPLRCNCKCIVCLFAVNSPDARLFRSHGQSELQKIVVRTVAALPMSLLGCNGAESADPYNFESSQIEGLRWRSVTFSSAQLLQSSPPREQSHKIRK